MKLLIIETSAERQSDYARRIHEFGHAEIEMLDLSVSLAGESDFEQFAGERDVALLGAGLGEQAFSIARKCRALNPDLKLILFASKDRYSATTFRTAYAAGIQKVLAEETSTLDFLQELVAIRDVLRRSGVVQDGQVVCVVQAKGGVGATTIAAALGELSAEAHRQTLVWDLDVDSADLSRSLLRGEGPPGMLQRWLDGDAVITRETLRHAVAPVDDYLSVLAPPRSTMAESFDLVCHTHGVSITSRVVDLAENVYQSVVIDTAGRLGPATGTLLASADRVVIVIDDTVLGLTGLRPYLEFIRPALPDINSLRFLVNGTAKLSLAIREVRESLSNFFELPEVVWQLPPIPFDPQGTNWSANGKSIVSCCSRETRLALETCARHLELR